MEQPYTIADLQAARQTLQDAEHALHELLPPSVRPLGPITDTPPQAMVSAGEANAAIALVRSRYATYLDMLHSMHGT